MAYPLPEDTLTPNQIAEILKRRTSENIGLSYYSERAIRAKTFLIDLDDFNQKEVHNLYLEFCEKFDIFGSSLMPFDEIIIPTIIGVNIVVFKHDADIVCLVTTKIHRNNINYSDLTPALVAFEFPGKINIASLTKRKLPEDIQKFFRSVAIHVAASLSLINEPKVSRRVVTEMPRSLHAAGTPEHRQDFFAEYRICEINPFGDPPAPIVAVGSTKASPRAHERRGHFRTLASGKIISIRPTLVGDPSRGAILKDYRVTSKQEPV